MIIINENIIVTEDIFLEEFKCNLDACKGACCWEGDYGAPLEDEELPILDEIYEKVEPYLTKEGKAIIEKEGKYTYYKESKEYGTPLLEGGACAYLTYNEEGIALCGIEQAYRAGDIAYYKPISCHLYPIRIKKLSGAEALNYDRWDICSAACELGKANKVPVYKFAKNALVRRYGEEFYEQLDAAVEQYEVKNDW